MKIVKNGAQYVIYGNEIHVYDRLGAGVYAVGFSKMQGFFLTDSPSISIGESKVYGGREKKVDMILKKFERNTRSLGVILSGPKGIGKSLFARMLCVRSIASGLPVILYNNYIPGIAHFLQNIEQECVVLFDEFDKTVGGMDDDAKARQTEFLGLFDGVISTKKLFVVTCNETRSLSEYFLNRPGRFHYHIRFDYPTTDEVVEYLEDQLGKNSEIQKVADFSKAVELNYDCLRAIAEELELGGTLEEVLEDLNIQKVTTLLEVSVVAVLKDGTKSAASRHNWSFGSFGGYSPNIERCVLVFASESGEKTIARITVSTNDIIYSGSKMVIAANDFIDIAMEGPEDEAERIRDKISHIEIKSLERYDSRIDKYKFGGGLA